MTLDNVHKRLLDNLKTGVVLLDSKLHLLYINMAAESLLDVSNRKARNLFIGEVFISAEQEIGEMQTALNTRSSFTKHKAQLCLLHGKLITVDYTISPFEENGETQALLELSSLEHAHRIDREETLSSAHATTRELVRGLAHEIKNPLGGIRGAAQLLAQELPGLRLAKNGDQDGDQENDLTDYTNVIIEEADRLRNLVDRLVGPRKPLNASDINIHEVLERVRSLVAAEVSGHGIEILRDYDPSIPPVFADPEQLIQAMLNIVRNAMQSLTSPDIDHKLGKIHLRSRVVRNVTIGSRFCRLAASIQVIDNGPGIPDDIIDTVFYPMISGRADGTGLGLSITHSIVNQHQGSIECDSKPGATCFSIMLPIDENV